MPEIAADWVAVTPHGPELRLRAMAGHDVLAEGRATLDTLRDSVKVLTGALPPLVACGLPQAGLRKVPCTPLDQTITPAAVGGVSLAMIPGLAQDSPAHVTQGAETAIAGFLTVNPKFDGVLCLPGTETTWAQISAEEVVSFQSFLTGGLAGAMAVQLGLTGEEWDDDAFAEALSDTMAKPERLAGRLASLRAERLVSGLSDGAARARLMGVLIGAELAAARPYWL
ncbi:MAG: 2-dehydro-3-deoxygalactonokinase, partial [Paracoccaceae bacterium]